MSKCGKFLPAVLGFTLLAAGVAPAADKPSADDLAKGQKKVEAELERLKGQGAQVKALDDEAINRELPGQLVYSVIYRQYPVARPTPEPLKSGNVYVVNGDKLELLNDAASMEKFLKGALKPVKDEDAARDAVKVWLLFSQETHQDGFFKFSIPDKELVVTVEKKVVTEATGKSVVDPKGGDKGEISVKLTFDGDGKLTKAVEDANLKAGVRPICQATKLLDADPLVRRMAEKDILVMGRYAKSYLDEQRAKAAPELQKAIDRIWQQILDEDR
jgi:hypothetical protein